jgi:hypothetical protein
MTVSLKSTRPPILALSSFFVGCAAANALIEPHSRHLLAGQKADVLSAFFPAGAL